MYNVYILHIYTWVPNIITVTFNCINIGTIPGTVVVIRKNIIQRIQKKTYDNSKKITN